jgi:preprotein translocase subunit YajC
MDFLINTAWAASSGGGGGGAHHGGGSLIQFLPLIVLVILFYFLLIRPQMKRSKQQRQMISALAKGDEVVTSGGVAGRIVDVGENFLLVEIADDTAVKIQRQSVSSVLPKGTLKSL